MPRQLSRGAPSVSELNSLGCKVLPRFDQGLSYVRAMLGLHQAE